MTLAIFGAKVMNMMSANRSSAGAESAPAPYGPICVSESASVIVPIAIIAIQAGEPRYIQIANSNWKRLTGFRPGKVRSCQYCILPCTSADRGG